MAPVGSADAVLLVLGSLPGEASLAAHRYYAHPQNQFWRLLGAALGEPLAALDYEERLARLAERGVALWDVVGEAMREGSLDGALRAVRANLLSEFVETHPRLGTIAFNGKTAARIGRRALGDRAIPKLIDLPSSSPAFTLAFATKAARWAVLGELALGPKRATLGQ
jgi:hypoxanthine-DNA glycosylase